MEKTTLLWGNLHLLFIIYFDQRPEIDIWNLLDILIDKKSKKNIFDFYYFQNKEKFKFLKICLYKVVQALVVWWRIL